MKQGGVRSSTHQSLGFLRPNQEEIGHTGAFVEPCGMPGSTSGKSPVQGGETLQSLSRCGAEAELLFETGPGDQETGEGVVVNVQKMQGVT